MKSIKECLEMDVIEDLENEVHERRELINQMVGSLYPSIVRDEISTINTQISWLRLCQANQNK